MLNRYVVGLFALLPAAAMAEITWETVESICEPATKFEYKGIHSGMTLAELEALSQSQPQFAPDNDGGSLVLGSGEAVSWNTEDMNTANAKDGRLYSINYTLSFRPSNPNWLKDSGVKVYEQLLAAHGDPRENRPPDANYKRWKLVYGPKEKMVTAPDGPWMKFLNACKAEAGSSSGALGQQWGHLMSLDLNFSASYQATKGLCPRALAKQYTDYLHDQLQPTVAFQALGDGFSMSTNCPMLGKWSYLQGVKKSEVAQLKRENEDKAALAVRVEGLTPAEEKERTEILKTCLADPYMHIYQDCNCVASAFVDERRKQGPDRSSNNILVGLRNQCRSSSGAGEQAYKDCMTNPMTTMFSKAPKETFCKCVSSSYVTRFEKFQGDMTAKARMNFASGAMTECGQKLK